MLLAGARTLHDVHDCHRFYLLDHPVRFEEDLGFSRAQMLCPDVWDCVPSDDRDCTEYMLAPDV